MAATTHVWELSSAWPRPCGAPLLPATAAIHCHENSIRCAWGGNHITSGITGIMITLVQRARDGSNHTWRRFSLQPSMNRSICNSSRYCRDTRILVPTIRHPKRRRARQRVRVCVSAQTEISSIYPEHKSARIGMQEGANGNGFAQGSFQSAPGQLSRRCSWTLLHARCKSGNLEYRFAREARPALVVTDYTAGSQGTE